MKECNSLLLIMWTQYYIMQAEFVCWENMQYEWSCTSYFCSFLANFKMISSEVCTLFLFGFQFSDYLTDCLTQQFWKFHCLKLCVVFMCWGIFGNFVSVEKLQLHPGLSILLMLFIELSLLDDSAVCFGYGQVFTLHMPHSDTRMFLAARSMDKSLQFQINQTTGYLPGVAQQSWGHFTGENFI